jgi:hypothetical protein
MLIYSTKKINKLKTNKIVRENIKLNFNSNVLNKIDVSTNIIDEREWLCQLSEINLVSHFQTQKMSKNGKLVFKWWEN